VLPQLDFAGQNILETTDQLEHKIYSFSLDSAPIGRFRSNNPFIAGA
jgi:hypothetical protein